MLLAPQAVAIKRALLGQFLSFVRGATIIHLCVLLQNISHHVLFSESMHFDAICHAALLFLGTNHRCRSNKSHWRRKSSWPEDTGTCSERHLYPMWAKGDRAYCAAFYRQFALVPSLHRELHAQIRLRNNDGQHWTGPRSPLATAWWGVWRANSLFRDQDTLHWWNGFRQERHYSFVYGASSTIQLLRFLFSLLLN